MSDRKTRPTDASVEEVIDAAAGERRRKDAREALDLIREVTGVEPVVWGPSMIGFGPRLGPHTTGKGCLYVKKLEALDREVLTEMVRRAWQENHQPE